MVDRNELITVFRQIGGMMEAGVDILRITRVLRAQTENKRLLRLYDALDHDMTMGHGLDAAMSHAPDVFSPFMILMVQQGEARNDLAGAFFKIADYLQKDGELFAETARHEAERQTAERHEAERHNAERQNAERQNAEHHEKQDDANWRNGQAYNVQARQNPASRSDSSHFDASPSEISRDDFLGNANFANEDVSISDAQLVDFGRVRGSYTRNRVLDARPDAQTAPLTVIALDGLIDRLQTFALRALTVVAGLLLSLAGVWWAKEMGWIEARWLDVTAFSVASIFMGASGLLIQRRIQSERRREARCSFCGRPGTESDALQRAPRFAGAAICSRCAAMVAEEHAAAAREHAAPRDKIARDLTHKAVPQPDAARNAARNASLNASPAERTSPNSQDDFAANVAANAASVNVASVNAVSAPAPASTNAETAPPQSLEPRSSTGSAPAPENEIRVESLESGAQTWNSSLTQTPQTQQVQAPQATSLMASSVNEDGEEDFE